ncbi:MAG: aspartate--tRNA ligase [Candidatus Spechtbacterales bacterium]
MDNRTPIGQVINNEGTTVTLAGWVSARRDHGKLVFLDLRDETGTVQVVISPKSKAAYEAAQDIRDEWVLSVVGTVQKRPESMVNPDSAMGTVEVPAEEIVVLNEAQTPPFPLGTDGYGIDEEARLRYRYLDLRRERLQRNLRLRSELVRRVRQHLFDEGFTEIETPLLTKSTPEGARDFIVPSRLHPGSFFALPQSPQQYKQLLMVGGFEKYFQIARALRDEDVRADRGFEHTQIDMEVAFADQEELRALNEELMITVFEAMGRTIKEKPFPVFTYREAIEKFGADKFDVRDEQEKAAGVLAFAWVVDFPFFEKIEESPSSHKATQGTSSPALRSSEGAKKWTFTHNPFSMPKEEHVEDLLAGNNLEGIIAQQYDLVCNGYEVGGGSVRAHKAEVLRATFRILGYSDDRIQKEFGHMLEAFSFGAPPHGGIAYGVERLTMLLSDETSLREVQAFPQTSSGRTSVVDAPAPVSSAQLEELGLRLRAASKTDQKDEQ